MLVLTGIDEAGYGPMLGPLCVGCATVVLDDYDPRAALPNLWATLKTAVCRKRRDAKNRIAIDDSKNLKGARDAKSAHPLKHLERGVLSFLAAGAELPESDTALVAALGATIPDLPWYAGHNDLPVGQTAGEIRIAAGRLRRACEQLSVRSATLACELIDADELNRQSAMMGTKAGVNLGAVMRHVEHVRRAWPDQHPRILVDRQGGRTHYLRELQMAFPDARCTVVHESEDLSRYRLGLDTGPLTISFTKSADARHLPVALGSMIAKYTRELLMLRLNAYFLTRKPELKATAGYVQDARRYLLEIETVLPAGIRREQLVRAV